MLNVFKAAEFTEWMNNLGKEVGLLNLRRFIADYDIDDHRGQLIANIQLIRHFLGDLPISPLLREQMERCEKRVEDLDDRNALAVITMIVELQANLVAELKARTILVLPAASAELFNHPDPFGAPVSALFPKAAVDVYESACCFALERWTAAVFHAMRAAEHALRYLATELGVERIEEKDFGQLVQEARAKNDALGSRDPEKKWVADALASLDLFKNAWRNPVCHARDDHYTQERARDVINGTRAFMQSLTRRATR